MEVQADELLKYGKAVAWCYAHHPDAVDLAGGAVARAIRTFDSTLGVPIKRWVARLVKQAIIAHWRKRAARPEVLKDEEFWYKKAVAPAEDQPSEVDPANRVLL